MNATGQWPGMRALDDAGRRKYLNQKERDCFLDAANCLAPRLRALCQVLTYTGCRISEALNLTVSHIDDKRMTLTFRTLKRRRLHYRVVPVPEALVKALRRLPHDAAGRLWPTHRATAWRMVKSVMDRIGIDGPRASPKGLRHGFGVAAASKNIPINLIQRWMGHASPTTTAIYIDLVGAEERQFAQRMW